MSTRKKTYCKKQNSKLKFSATEQLLNKNEKENICFNTKTGNTTPPVNRKDTHHNDKFDVLLSSPLEQKVKLKPLSFWTKKLKDLESEEVTPKKQCELYELTVTDELYTPEKKKKRTRKLGQKKKKEEAIYQMNFIKSKVRKTENKIKEAHERSLFREKIILNREKENLAHQNNKFTFSTMAPSLGITSTPAVNKVNLVGSSSFMFLSPIIKENDMCASTDNKLQTIAENSHTECYNKNTGSHMTALKNYNEPSTGNCKRVLRSRKVVNQK